MRWWWYRGTQHQFSRITFGSNRERIRPSAGSAKKPIEIHAIGNSTSHTPNSGKRAEDVGQKFGVPPFCHRSVRNDQ